MAPHQSIENAYDVYSSGGLEPFFHLVDELEAGRSAVLCVVVETMGSTPQVPGAMMLCTQSGGTVGTVGGGGCLEAEVRKKARDLLLNGGAIECTLNLDHDLSVKDGMICGGTMTAVAVSIPVRRLAEFREMRDRIRHGKEAVLLLEIPGVGAESELYALHLEPSPELIIAGAGHVGVEVAWLAHRLGFAVTVLDDRADFLVPGRFPEGTKTVADDIPTALRTLDPDPLTYVVVATRGHKDDLEAITTVIRRPLRYLGMLGSRRKIVTLFKELRHRGATEEDLARVFTPIGLEIGALTPVEIALSIVAQMVQMHRQGRASRAANPLARTASPASPSSEPSCPSEPSRPTGPSAHP